MKNIIIILLTFLLTSCASYKAISYQDDNYRCKSLIKEDMNAFYAAWYDRELLSRCLNGRGHNVLNTYTIGN